MPTMRKSIPGNCTMCFNIGKLWDLCENDCQRGHMKCRYKMFVPQERSLGDTTYMFNPIFIAKLMRASGENCLLTCNPIDPSEAAWHERDGYWCEMGWFMWNVAMKRTGMYSPDLVSALLCLKPGTMNDDLFDRATVKIIKGIAAREWPPAASRSQTSTPQH